VFLELLVTVKNTYKTSILHNVSMIRGCQITF